MATLTGTSGNNIITDPAGTDAIDARGGDDTIRIANGNFGVGETINGGSGNDTIALTSTSNVIDFSTGDLSNVEKLTGGTGNDVVTMSGNQYDNFESFDLGTGVDVLNVKVSGVVFNTDLNTPGFTSVENLNLTGTNSNELIIPAGGQLNVFNSIDLGSGIDTINLTSTSTKLNSLSNGLMNSVEIIAATFAVNGVNINLSNQTERFNLIGSIFDDTIYGGNGDDGIVGINGNDNLVGGSGNDILEGGLATIISRVARVSIIFYTEMPVNHLTPTQSLISSMAPTRSTLDRC